MDIPLRHPHPTLKDAFIQTPGNRETSSIRSVRLYRAIFAPDYGLINNLETKLNGYSENDTELILRYNIKVPDIDITTLAVVQKLTEAGYNLGLDFKLTFGVSINYSGRSFGTDGKLLIGHSLPGNFNLEEYEESLSKCSVFLDDLLKRCYEISKKEPIDSQIKFIRRTSLYKKLRQSVPQFSEVQELLPSAS